MIRPHERTISVDPADRLTLSPLVEEDRLVFTSLLRTNSEQLDPNSIWAGDLDPAKLDDHFNEELERIGEGEYRLGIRRGSELIGWVALSPQYSQPGVVEPTLDIFVDAGNTRQGVATRVIRRLAAEVFATQPGMTHIMASVATDNAAAVALFTTVGARPEELENDGFPMQTWRLYRD